MKIFKKLFKWTALTLLGLCALGVVAFISIAALDITLDLDEIRPAVATALSTALHRPARITGSVTLKPSLHPTLEIHGVEIDNPRGWTDTVFASMDLARVQVGIPALLRKQIDLGEISCNQVVLNLESNKKGRNNWQGNGRSNRTPEAEKTPKENTGGLSILALDKLSLKQIQIQYRDNSLGKVTTFALDELSGTAARGEPLQWHGKGHFQGKEYNFTIQGSALDELHLRQQLYPLSITGAIAGSPFTAKGKLGQDGNEPKLDLDLTLSKVNIGALLSWLQVAEGIEAETDQLALRLKLRGDSLRQLVTESKMIFTVKGGKYTLHGAGKGEGIPIAIVQGEVSSQSGKPLAITLKGTIGTTPIKIAIQGM